MGDSPKAEQAAAPVRFWRNLKAEFSKITWPDKDSLLKQSVAVVLIAIVVGIIIAVLDFLLQYGVDFLTTISL